MTAEKRPWVVRLTDAAARDFQAIIRGTAAQLGEAQALVYEHAIAAALEAVKEGPKVPGARSWDEIMRGLRSLHVARDRRKGRHLLLYPCGLRRWGRTS